MDEIRVFGDGRLGVLRDGRVCCSGRPENFCDRCKARLHMTSERAWTRFFAATLSSVPPPPDVRTVLQRRGQQPATPRVATSRTGVPAPPDVATFIRERRTQP